MNNIQVDIEFKTCNNCNIEKCLDDFYIMRKTYSASCKKCCIARNRENYLKSEKYLSKVKVDKKEKVKSKVRTKKCDIKKQLLFKEVTDFINKVERLRGYIDFVDAYRLVSLRVDCLGVKFYERISVQDELILSYGELKKWQKDAFQK